MSTVHNFPGGIHPHEGRGGKAATAGLSIVEAPQPSRVAIPLQQHIGAPCKPLVTKGDAVKTGQMIGEPVGACLLYTSPSPRDLSTSRMPSSA